MANNSANKVEMKSLDDLFGLKDFGGTKEDSGTKDTIKVLELDKLVTFRNHPFKVCEDDKMRETVESIKQYGVLQPIIVRPLADGRYEIISGHRRTHACKLLERKNIPALIRNLSDDEATVLMVDSNIQRENLDYSEKAFAFRMKYEALKHQGKAGKETAALVGEEAGESGRQIKRYIRLTYLNDGLLQLVDKGKIGFIPGVNLSYLDIQEQEELLCVIRRINTYPSLEQSVKLKEKSEEKQLSPFFMESILAKGKRSSYLQLDKLLVGSYFPSGTSQKEMQDTIYSLLEGWKRDGGK